MRGCGKTTVGKLLAANLGMDFADSDDIVALQAGMSIAELVKCHGWEAFREREAAVIGELASQDNTVIGTGGGVITREENIAALRKRGKIVWLEADIDILLARLGEHGDRPSLTGRPFAEDLRTVLTARYPIYLKTADFSVDTSDREPAAIAQLIAEFLKGSGSISAATLVCGVIGNPVAHSLSPTMHNRAYRALGLDYVYLAFTTADINRAVDGIRGLNIRGVSVTIPHKEAACQLVDELDQSARDCGAVNTIVNDRGMLRGYNSDGAAALRAIEETTPVKGKQAVLLGAGGAATAIAAALNGAGARLTILNRHPERAAALANRFNAATGGLDDITKISGADILINATPVGMWPETEASPVPAEALHRNLTVFDAVYNPRMTRLLCDAGAAGAKIVPGDKMLLYLAAAQFKLFTGREAPLEVMAAALNEALGGEDHA